MSELVLHVGMPQASHAIGRALERLRPQLRARGVAYVGAKQIDHLDHVDGWNNHEPHRAANASAFESELRDAVSQERDRAAGLTGTPATRVVVVAEGLLGLGSLGRRDTPTFRPLAQHAVGHVVRALRASDVHIVLHTHRQDRLIELQQLHHIFTGDQTSLRDRFPYLMEPQLDYCDLVTRLSSVPNVSTVTVRPVELITAGTQAFVHDFLAQVGLRDEFDLYRIGADVLPWVPVLSPRGVALAESVAPLMQTGAELASWRRFLTEHYLESSPLATDLMNGETRDEVLASYNDVNRELFARHMPGLPVDSYADDVRTFALGNVLSPAVGASERGVRAVEETPAARAVAGVARRARKRAGRLRRLARR